MKSLEISIPLYERMLNTLCYKIEEVDSEGVRTAFFKIGPNKIELLESTRAESPIAKFIEKKGEGIHHIAYAVADIHKQILQLQKEGFEIINPNPKKGADGKEIVFLHPKSSGGILIELCADINSTEE